MPSIITLKEYGFNEEDLAELLRLAKEDDIVQGFNMCQNAIFIIFHKKFYSDFKVEYKGETYYRADVSGDTLLECIADMFEEDGVIGSITNSKYYIYEPIEEGKRKEWVDRANTVIEGREKIIEHNKECFWCGYFRNFDRIVIYNLDNSNDPITSNKFLSIMVPIITRLYFNNIPLIITLAKFHSSDIKPGLIEKMDRHVPQYMKTGFRKLTHRYVLEDCGTITLKELTQNNDNSTIEYDLEIGKIKSAKSAKK